MTASWPTLHPDMAERSQHWASASAETLEAELQSYVRQASAASCDDATRRRLFAEQSRKDRPSR